MTILTLIAAIAENGVIGKDGALPWRLPADLKRFKALTMGRPVIMGRRTFASIGKPLPGRTNIVLTRDKGFRAAGAWVANSVAEALAMARRQARGEMGEAFVIGGAEIYADMLPYAERLDLTRIHRDFAGDTFFPDFDPAAWDETWREEHLESDPPYSFVVLDRII
jgi:dihydrofolate reductase